MASGEGSMTTNVTTKDLEDMERRMDERMSAGVKEMKESTNATVQEMTKMIMEMVAKKVQDMSQQGVITATSGHTLRNEQANPSNTTREEAAKKAQQDYQFDVDDVYETLVDPRPRSKKELEIFATNALSRYKAGEVRNLRDSFLSDFRYWDTSHFRLLKKHTAEDLRDVLREKGVNVVIVSRNNAQTNLGQFVHNAWVLDQAPKKTVNIVKEVQTNRARDNNAPVDVEQEDCAPKLVNCEDDTRRNRYSRPTDVAKLFGKEQKYSGATTQSIRRRYKSSLTLLHFVESKQMTL